MNVLSLFDGMSCGQIALNRLGIKYDNYYAAEIDKYAIEVTKKNFPNTIHLGDVTKVKAADLEPIDLLMGGSPCQGFSFAGKQLNFDDPRSALFFEFVRLLKECKPKYFLLENVRMKKIYQDVITEHLGVEPIMINSSLLSAQSRHRLYWTNIPNVQQPQDKGLVIKDILEDLPFDDPPNYLNGNFGDRTRGSMVSSVEDDKANCLVASMWKGQIPLYIKNPERLRETPNYWQMDVSGKGYASQQDRIRKIEKPSNSLAAGSASIPKVMCGAFRGRYYDENGKRTDHKESVRGKTTQHLEIREDGKTNSITTVQKDNVVVYDNEQLHKNNYKKLRDESQEKVLATQINNSKNFGNAVQEKKAFTLRASQPNGVINKEQYYYRKLTPIECERLQTVPDNYTQGVSNTQRYKMLGNGWTVDVIVHILKNIHEENNNTLQTQRTATTDSSRDETI